MLGANTQKGGWDWRMDGMIGTERRVCSGCSFNDMTYILLILLLNSICIRGPRVSQTSTESFRINSTILFNNWTLSTFSAIQWIVSLSLLLEKGLLIYSSTSIVYFNPSSPIHPDDSKLLKTKLEKRMIRAASDFAGCSSLRVDKETADDNGFRIERTPSRTYPGPAPRGKIDFIHEIPYQTWIPRPRRPCSCHEFKAQPSDIAIKHFFINSTSVRGGTEEGRLIASLVLSGGLVGEALT